MSSTEKEIFSQLRAIHRRVAFWYYLVICSMWIVVQAGFLVLLVPNLAKNYDDMDTPLPRITTLLISASDWMVSPHFGLPMPGWMLAVPAAVLVLIVSMLAFRRITILLTLIPIVAVISLIGQLFMLLAPLYTLTDSLTQ